MRKCETFFIWNNENFVDMWKMIKKKLEIIEKIVNLLKYQVFEKCEKIKQIGWTFWWNVKKIEKSKIIEKESKFIDYFIFEKIKKNFNETWKNCWKRGDFRIKSKFTEKLEIEEYLKN